MYNEEVPKTTTIRKRSQAEKMASRMTITICCLFLATLVFIPMWNCYALWNDKVYTYFAGDWVPKYLFVVCAGLWVFGFVLFNIFFVRVPPGQLSEQKLISVASIFLTLLGVVLTLYSEPLYKQSVAAYEMLWDNCEFAPYTRPLYAVHKQLSVMRNQSSCRDLQSVERCASFQNYPYMLEANVLKSMENTLQCSGFCYKPPEAANTTFLSYPPTLFSKDNYQASCEGAAARHIKFFVAASSTLFAQEGICLLVTVVVVGLMKLVPMCRSAKEANLEEGYGSL